jgi:hypothetical protein
MVSPIPFSVPTNAGTSVRLNAQADATPGTGKMKPPLLKRLRKNTPGYPTNPMSLIASR